MTQALVKIQISPESVPSTPSWFAEAAIVAQVLAQTGLLKTLEQRVRFKRSVRSLRKMCSRGESMPVQVGSGIAVASRG